MKMQLLKLLSFPGCIEAGVGQAAEAGAQDGGGRAQEAAGEGARLQVHRMRQERQVQLRGHAAAGETSRNG